VSVSPGGHTFLNDAQRPADRVKVNGTALQPQQSGANVDRVPLASRRSTSSRPRLRKRQRRTRHVHQAVGDPGQVDREADPAVGLERYFDAAFLAADVHKDIYKASIRQATPGTAHHVGLELTIGSGTATSAASAYSASRCRRQRLPANIDSCTRPRSRSRHGHAGPINNVQTQTAGTI